jgi:hypothetical protein
MICIFKLDVCCGGSYWKLISLISIINKDTINKIIKNCDNSLPKENINEHIYYGKRNDDILIEDHHFNYWFVVEEIDVIIPNTI